MGSVGVVIAAGGRGRRMGGRVPKQFLRLRGQSVLALSVSRFVRHPEVSEVVIVAPRGHLRRVESLLKGIRPGKVRAVVPGGRERQESVRRGLEALSPDASIVLVHDAVRPLVRPAVISGVIREARKHGAAVAGVPLLDTIKREGSSGFVTATVPRDRLWAVQTPQGFRRSLLLRAHHRAASDRFVGTDECALVERLGKRIRIVAGDWSNLKITTRGDLRLAEFLLGGK